MFLRVLVVRIAVAAIEVLGDLLSAYYDLKFFNQDRRSYCLSKTCISFLFALGYAEPEVKNSLRTHAEIWMALQIIVKFICSSY